MAAASCGDLAATLALLELGANSALRDATGRTAVLLARTGGHASCVEVLECGHPFENSLAQAAVSTRVDTVANRDEANPMRTNSAVTLPKAAERACFWSTAQRAFD